MEKEWGHGQEERGVPDIKMQVGRKGGENEQDKILL